MTALARIHNVQTLLAAIESEEKVTSDSTSRRHIMRRARSLGRFDLIPDTWKRQARSERPETVDLSASALSDANQELALKASQHQIDISLLRSVYVRGLREFSELPEPPHHLATRDEWAQARVNSFIRAYSGDPATRKTDYDLLQP